MRRTRGETKFEAPSRLVSEFAKENGLPSMELIHHYTMDRSTRASYARLGYCHDEKGSSNLREVTLRSRTTKARVNISPAIRQFKAISNAAAHWTKTRLGAD